MDGPCSSGRGIALVNQIFITLPVTDIAKARGFYQALGWALDPRFADDDSACVVVSASIYLMLATQGRFAAIAPKPMLSPRDGATALIALSCASRAEVDALTQAAIAAGGRSLHEAEDLGFMYSCAFEDPDGNGFGPFFWVND